MRRLVTIFAYRARQARPTSTVTQLPFAIRAMSVHSRQLVQSLAQSALAARPIWMGPRALRVKPVTAARTPELHKRPAIRAPQVLQTLMLTRPLRVRCAWLAIIHRLRPSHAPTAQQGTMT